MWCPIRIEFNNLFSNLHSECVFKNNECTIITGENRTDKNLDNNGAGKSTLFEAVSLALTGESLRAIKKDSFINDSPSAKSCKIIFDLRNDVNGDEIRIEREFFKSSKSSTVSVYENGNRNNQLVSVLEANKRIIDLLGICKDDLTRYFIIGQDNRYNFFTANDSEKKEILNRITNADVVNSIIAKLDSDIKEKQAFLDVKNNDESKILGKIEIIEEQVKKLLENDGYEDEIKRIEDEIKRIEEKRKSYTSDIASKNNELVALRDKFSKLKRVDITALRDKFSKLNKKRDDIDDKLLEANKLKNKLALIIDGVLECPKCGEKFVLENDLKIDYAEAVEVSNELVRDIEEKREQINRVNDNISKVSLELKSARDKNNEIDDLENKISNKDKAVKEMFSDIKMLENRQKKLSEDLDYIKTGKLKAERINELKLQKKKLLKDYNDIENLVHETNDELDMLKFWYYNLGKSGFQTYLANMSIKMLEGTMNTFLNRMNIDYRVRIDPYKILKSGDVRERIDCFVSSNGNDWKNFLTYSGGERQRIILAGILSIQKLINDSLDGNGLNMLLLDESLGNIDTCGTMEIVKILENIGVTTMIITQNIEEPKKIFKNYLSVVKVDGVSKFQS